MIQFARAIGLEVSVATIGMLEDALLKTGGITGRNVVNRSSEQSPSFRRAASTVVESVASRLFHSLFTSTESFDSDPSAGFRSHQLCPNRQVDAALGFF